MRKTCLRFYLMLLIWGDVVRQLEAQENNTNASTKFIKVGEDVTIECNFCNIDGLQWTYKGPNRSQEEIATKNKIIRKKHQGKNFSWFELTNNSTCQYSLYLPKIQFGSAGLYCCWENMIKKVIANIVVISDTLKCSSEPEFSDSNNIFLKQEDQFTIKCSFEYSADESCIVTPIWTDLTGYRNLMIPANDFEANMDDKHAWIHFKPGADIRSGTRFNFSLAFNCSSLNNNDTIWSGLEDRYDFGQIPFTLCREKNQKRDPTNNLLTFCLIVVITFAAIVLVLMFSWKFYKLFHVASISTKYDASVIGKELPEIPMENLGTLDDHRRRDAAIRLPEDATYDVINDFI